MKGLESPADSPAQTEEKRLYSWLLLQQMLFGGVGVGVLE